MDIPIILKVIIGLLAVIGAIEVTVRFWIPSVTRLGIGGIVLGTLIVIFMLYFVFSPGSILESVGAYAALTAFTIVGGLNLLRWGRVIPARWRLQS